MTTIQKKCPRCCPDHYVDFDRDYRADNGYRCRNCSFFVIVKKRPPKIGGRRQVAAVEQVRKQLEKRFVLVEPDTEFWAERGVVYLMATPRPEFWNESVVSIKVGPNGSIMASRGAESMVTGRKARALLRVLSY